MFKTKSIGSIIIFSSLGLIALYILLNQYYINDTKLNNRFNIGILSKVNSKGKGGWECEFYYLVNNNRKIGRYNITKDSIEYFESQINKRFLVKTNDKIWVNRLFFTTKLYINRPIPNNIKNAPLQGWKELPSWAK
ncbi:hypothetical protein HX096_09140 [Empedobacter falsenii]|uniref:hypothetical protein n=1 Tax=Empedobacter falsenii TaxID=343874 RepID=UPI002574DD57|nr:hypothetical protein [Empedobacter falsenii]MDM1548021.1 hypothetical protein [Empedobacter falsenii]